MKICIDIQSAIAQRAGVGRYTQQLIENLGHFAGHDDEINATYFDFKRKALPFASGSVKPRAIRYCPGRVAQLMWKKLNWPPYDAFAGSADIYHFPNFIIPPLNRGKSIVTIHDMSFLRHPAFAEEENQHYLADRINNTVSRADAIITDSKFSAAEIHSLLDVDMEKIHAVHLGINQDFKAPDRDDIAAALHKLDVDMPYILTVGTVEPRKNLIFLIEAFERMHEFGGNLVIAGMPGWKYEPIMERIKTSPKSSRIRYLRYVDDALLPALYAGAEIYSISSIYEGFGFPPLEAMACGTPVVSSTGGSLAEVLGDAAIVLDEFNPDIWAAEMTRLISDKQLNSEYAARGLEHVKQYTWKSTAEKTWDVYRSVAG